MTFSLDEFELDDSVGHAKQSLGEKIDKNKHPEPKKVPLANPLNRIALCMSGGGFRAASFALGTLSYLNRAKFGDKTLLDHVCYISSASGGTITASMFALSKTESSYSFQKFYENMVGVLKGDILLITALKILINNKEWKNGKNRNLINAFSIAYDKLLYNKAEFGVLYDNELRVCFNATEFYRGLCFRFQNHGYIGNQYINLDKRLKTITDKVKLADVLAASSCFPAGFEPIEFPKDFAHGSLTKRELQSTICATGYKGVPVKNAVIPLMDGGIADNQGLNSAIIADLNARESGQDPIDLFIVTDVASYFMDHYKIPKPKSIGFWKLRLNFIKGSFAFLGLVGFASSIMLWLYGGTPFMKFIGGFIFFPSALVVVWLILYLLRLLWYRLNGKDESFAGIREAFSLDESFSDEIFNTLRNFLGKSRLGVLEQLITNRLGSVVTMVSDINLKHVRRLINQLFYNNSLFDNRRCSNYIYDYSELNKESMEKRLEKKRWPDVYKELLKPSEKLMKIAEEARTMGTTLWFDKNEQQAEKLKKLILCGEFTTCGNLLEYVLELRYASGVWTSLVDEIKQKINDLEEELIRNWKNYNEL